MKGLRFSVLRPRGRTIVGRSGGQQEPSAQQCQRAHVSDSPAIRQAAVDRLKHVVDICQASGVEKLCENSDYHHVISQVDPLEYVSSLFTEWAPVMSFEKLLDVER